MGCSSSTRFWPMTGERSVRRGKIGIELTATEATSDMAGAVYRSTLFRAFCRAPPHTEVK